MWCQMTSGMSCIMTSGMSCIMTSGMSCIMTSGMSCIMTSGMSCIVTSGMSYMVTSGMSFPLPPWSLFGKVSGGGVCRATDFRSFRRTWRWGYTIGVNSLHALQKKYPTRVHLSKVIHTWDIYYAISISVAVNITYPRHRTSCRTSS